MPRRMIRYYTVIFILKSVNVNGILWGFRCGVSPPHDEQRVCMGYRPPRRRILRGFRPPRRRILRGFRPPRRRIFVAVATIITFWIIVDGAKIRATDNCRYGSGISRRVQTTFFFAIAGSGFSEFSIYISESMLICDPQKST